MLLKQEQVATFLRLSVLDLEELSPVNNSFILYLSLKEFFRKSTYSDNSREFILLFLWVAGTDIGAIWFGGFKQETIINVC